jgi:hypothetical protein
MTTLHRKTVWCDSTRRMEKEEWMGAGNKKRERYSHFWVSVNNKRNDRFSSPPPPARHCKRVVKFLFGLPLVGHQRALLLPLLTVTILFPL